MSDAPFSPTEPVAVRLRGVHKLYRLYRKPMYRVLDLLGLCPAGSAFYGEHAALKGIDLTIRRGEKVAIIGRNGAGKSTLLKVITQTLSPTAGQVEIHGKISALLQIGTGFHPDFTGRQNAYSAMAHQGITGRVADSKFQEIVEFAELDEFIDQPMKTYSTGMCARLMFSASVVIDPDILVVDEVLGVGDAYFTHKSFERMRQLCASHGATLLLVTHDIYSAQRLCDRYIWLDRGQIQFDGGSKQALALYETSIKQQEEEYLQRRSLVRIQQQRQEPAGYSRVLVTLRTRTGFALASPMALEHLELRYGDATSLPLAVAEGAPQWSLLPHGNLGPPQVLENRSCRLLGRHGSIYHKVEWSVALPRHEGLRSLRVVYRHPGQDPVDLLVSTEDKRLLLEAELPAGPQWQEQAFELGNPKPAGGRSQEQTEFGTGLVRITAVEFFDGEGRSTTSVRHGQRLTVRLTLELAEDFSADQVTLALGLYRPGNPFSGVVYRDRLPLAHGPGNRRQELDIVLDPLLLGGGTWLVTPGLGEPDLFLQKDLRYFTVDPRWYHMICRGFELQVEPGPSADRYAFMVHPAAIDCRALDGSAAAASGGSGEVEVVASAQGVGGAGL